MSRLAAGLSHVARVEGQHHEATFRQLIGVDRGALLLDAAVGRAHDEGRVLLLPVHPLRRIEVAGDGQTVAVLVTHVLPRHILT